VALVMADVSEEGIVSIITLTGMNELGTTLAVTTSSNQRMVTANVVLSTRFLATLMMEAIRSSETSLLTRATRRRIPQDGIRHSHRRENFKSALRRL
jgi:hypothetical protein